MLMNSHAIVLIVVMSVVTILLRFLPFWIFANRKTPDIVVYFGQVLPYAIMGMLVIFCLKNVSFMVVPFGIPEMIASLIVIVLHVYKRNTLLSILGGTLGYMVLVQVIF